MGRSGTTLIAAILHRHSNICVLPETGFFVHVNSLAGGWTEFAERWPKSMLDIAEKMQPRATNIWDPLSSAQHIIQKNPTYPGEKTVFYELCEFICRKANKQRATLILEKTPDHMLFIHDIKQLFPQAPVIHIVRDGRAVAESRSRVPFLTETRRNIEYNALEWARRMREIRPTILNHDHVYEFRYEDLIENTEKQVRNILTFLGTEFEDGVFQPNGNEDHLIEKGMSHKNKIKSKIDSSLASYWKNSIPSKQQALLEQLSALELEKLGYPLFHIHSKRSRKAFIPESLASPDILKKHLPALKNYLKNNETVTICDFYRDLLTININNFDDLIIASNPIKKDQINSMGSIKYFLTLIKCVIKIIMNKKRIIWIAPTREWSISKWPLAWLSESILYLFSKKNYLEN